MRVLASLALAAGTVALWRYWLLGLTVRELPAEALHAESFVNVKPEWRTR